MDKRIIHTVFEQTAATHPQKVAVEDSKGTISYQDLNHKANQLGNLFLKAGAKKGDRVAVMLQPGIALIRSVLSIFKTGGIYVPVDKDFSESRMQQVFEDCKPDVLLLDEESLTWLKENATVAVPKTCLLFQENEVYSVNTDTWEYTSEDLSAYSSENLPLVTDKEDPNYIIYTSGSTGKARAILGSTKGLGHFIHWETNEFGLDETCRVSFLSQFTFDASLRDMFVALSCGGTVCIPSQEQKSNVPKLLEWIESKRITLIHCVPSVLRLLTKELPAFKEMESLKDHLKYILIAGEPLYNQDIEQWRASAGEEITIVNLYGTSETTLAKTFHRIGALSGEPSALISVGKPISNTQVIICNGKTLCSPGEIGEVFIKTPFMTKGYYNNEEQTAAVFIQNPLTDNPDDLVHKTGDFGKYLDDRSIEILGRQDDQVKVNGIRVELGEVTGAVKGLEGIEDADVIAHTKSSFEKELICYYTGEKSEPEALIQRLEKKLNKNIIPSFFIWMDEFPLTINGKKDKKAYPKVEQVVLSNEEYEAPVGLIEESLETICKEIFGLPKLSRNVSFFKMGANSLKVIQLIGVIYREYQLLFKYMDIFQNNTIEKLAVLINENRTSDTVNSIPKVSPSETYQVSVNQEQLYAASKFDDDQIAFNIPLSYVFRGSLNKDAFRQAFGMMMERHEIFRTRFVFEEGSPRQSILPLDESAAAIKEINLKDAEHPMQEAEKIAMDEAQTVFDLEKGPMVQACLMEIDPACFVFTLTMHHIISDGWSLQVIVHEILSAYESLTKGEKVSLPELPIQYKDYAAWQRDYLEDVLVKTKHRKYWINKLDNLPEAELMPLDFSRTEFMDFAGRSKNFVLDKQRTAAIQEIYQKQEATLFMFLLAVINILLSKTSGQRDIVIGSPLAGRPHKDLENLAGLFVNMVTFRTNVTPESSFMELLKAVKKEALMTYDHELYPFQWVVKELNLDQEVNRNSIFDIVLQLQNAKLKKVEDMKLNGVAVDNFLPNSYSSKFDITFNFEEIADDRTLSLDIEYKTSLFKDETISHLFDDISTLIDAIIADPSVKVEELIEKITDTDTLDAMQSLSSLIGQGISDDF